MRKLLSRRFISLSALVILIASFGFAAACDTEVTVTWVNETDITIGIYFGDNIDSFDLSVAPHSTGLAGTISDTWQDAVVIRDEAGNVLYREEITWDELKAQDFTFVITEDDIAQD